MIVSYILFISTLAICVLVAFLSEKYNSKALSQIIILLFVFISGCRGPEVGLDTINYISIWDNLLAGQPVYVEPGFRWLIYSLQKISTNSSILFVVCSFIIYELIISRLWTFRTALSFPIAIAVLYMTSLMPSMNIMRQYCSVAIVFYVIKYLLNGEYIKYILGIVIASLIHYSSALALLYLPIVDMCNWNNLKTRRKILWLLLVTIAPIFSGLAFSFIETKYGLYFENRENNVGALTMLKIIFIMASFIVSKLWTKQTTNLGHKLTQSEMLLVKVSFIACLFGIAFESLSYFFPFMGRIALPFSLFGIVYWGILFKCTLKLRTRRLYFCALALLIGLPFLIAVLNNAYGVVPYYFSWS